MRVTFPPLLCATFSLPSKNKSSLETWTALVYQNCAQASTLKKIEFYVCGVITVMEPLKYLSVEVHGMEGKIFNQALDFVKDLSCDTYMIQYS